ncbi:MAG: MmgE/PrpD family protein [Dehalobacterium sp.]
MTSGITDFIVGSMDYCLNSQAIHGAKRAMIDCIGVMLAGSKEEVAEIACQTYSPYQAVNATPVFGRNFKIEPTTAALLNGISAHALDYDDSSETMYGHPSGSVLPACLALASIRPVSGRDFLLAYITGIEIASKMSLSVPGHYDWGWHNSSTLGSLGAAAACARLLSLDSSATGRTLGIAASLASGIKQNFGTMTKPLHMGNAARNGVLAALLAERGFTSDKDALGGPQGFCKVFSGGGAYKLEETLRSLGNPWEVADPGIRIKLYPCCTSNHRPVESVILIAKEYDIDPREIARVDCGVIYKVPDILIRSDPHSGVEAKFSLQYCVARALISRKLILPHFDTEQVLDPLVRSLMKKVSMYVHEEGRKEVMTRQFAETGVIMKDGRVLVKRVYEQEGHPSRPLTDEQVCLKFKECASRVLNKVGVSNILDLLWNVETLPNMNPVLKVLDSVN